MKIKLEERIDMFIALPKIWSQHNLSVKWRSVNAKDLLLYM